MRDAALESVIARQIQPAIRIEHQRTQFSVVITAVTHERALQKRRAQASERCKFAAEQLFHPDTEFAARLCAYQLLRGARASSPRGGRRAELARQPAKLLRKLVCGNVQPVLCCFIHPLIKRSSAPISAGAGVSKCTPAQRPRARQAGRIPRTKSVNAPPKWRA